MELVGQALASLRAARGGLGGLAGARAHEELLAMLGHVDAAVSVLRSGVLGAVGESGDWALAGDRDLPAWVARTSRAGTGAGFSQVREAQALAGMPKVADALAAGTLTTAHVASLGKVTAGASDLAAQVFTSDEGQAKVVHLAATLDPRRFTAEIAAMAAKADPGKVQRDHDQARSTRSLTIGDAQGMTRIHGRIDRIAGKTLRLALEGAGGQPPAGDTRTKEERDADALVALAQYSVDTPPERLSAERPHIALVMSEETWAGLREHTNDDGTDSPGAGSTAAVLAALDGHEPVRDIDGVVWPASELAALACDCEITRMVIDAHSQVLDAGHEVRLFHGRQRRTITTRDGGCAWPGCTMPARYTELHHMDWWKRDQGTTSVERGVALCSFHHHRVHDLDLAIERLSTPGRGLAGQATATYQFLRRDGTVFCDERHRPPDHGTALPNAGQPEPAHHDAAFANQARMGHPHPDTRGSARRRAANSTTFSAR